MSFCKNRTPKQILLASAVLLALSTQASHAVITLTFQNNTSPLATFPATINNPGSGVPFATAFATGMEFRMISPFASIGGGGEKNAMDGGETWTFSNAGLFTAVSGTPMNSGAANSPVAPTAGTNPTLQQAAPFFGSGFTFLAPVSGSLAGTAYGVSTINFDSTGKTLTVTHQVLEAQWGGTYFPLGKYDTNGSNGLGITMSGSYTCTPSNCSGDPVNITFVITAEELIDPAEDPGSAGFSFWTAQWELHGTGSVPATVLTPPASPTSANGTLAPTTGGPADGNATNDGRMTKAQSDAASWGADPGDDGNGDGTNDGMVDTCVGGCFDFTVTGLTSGQSDQIILNLPIPIPAGAVYRKYNGDGTGTETWHNFDTSTGDSVVSGTGTSTSCAGVAYGSGLTAGDYCIRLTITDGGPNDRDGTANGTIVDPGGVGVKAVAPPPPREGHSLDNAKGGCSMSTVPVDLSQRADWWLVAGFFVVLGWLRGHKRRKTHVA